jgi:tripartite-type tricarboxylate transporter receptor subunit TctC
MGAEIRFGDTKMNRRNFLVGAGTAMSALPHAAFGQAWPARNITLVVPFPPGGTNDIFARAIADKLGAALGVAVIIDNRGGAGGTIGSTAVARAAPDGYTLMTGHIGTLGVNPSLYPNLAYDTLTSFDYVAALGLVPNLLVVHPGLPFRTVPDLIAYARANPGKLNYSTAGAGSAADIAMAAFNVAAKTQMVPVPYRGTAPAVTDLLAGQVQLTITGATAVLQHAQAGTLRALGVTTLKRIRVAPDIPAIAETLPGFEASQWYGIVTPAHTPAPILKSLEEEIRRVMHMPDVLARLETEGVELWEVSPAEFRAYVAKEIPRWKAVVEAAKLNAAQ